MAAGMNEKPPLSTAPQQTQLQIARRENDAVYQNGRLVARVADPEIDLDAREIRFAELYNSDCLLLPDECEFRQHRILIRKITYATNTERAALQKGRILRGVKAEILGYREQ